MAPDAQHMNTKDDAELQVENHDSVLLLTLNRPDRFNALSRNLSLRLLTVLSDAAIDPAVRCVVLTGAGRAFCAGGDVEAQLARTAEPSRPADGYADMLRARMETSRLLHKMPKPTIAMLNGIAAGAGMSLALACDIRFAGDLGRMTTAFAKVGLSGDFGGSYFLTKLVGPAIARELYFTSAVLDSARLLELKLVNRCFPNDVLLSETLRFAADIGKGPAMAYRHMKRNLNSALDSSLEEVMDLEVEGMQRTRQTADHKEGALAFIQKRTPTFGGV